MSLFDRKIFSEKKIGKEIYFILPVVFWFVFIMISLLWNLNIVEKSIEQSLLSVGRSFFREIINTRLWNSMHGGVYVPVTEKTLPNKYLEDKDRDVVTLSGLHLTKVNPAYMTRQIGEIARLYSHIVYHITSLNPIRPGNKARDWEVIALNSFVKGKKEYFRLDDKKEVYLYMAPLITGESCIKCHAKQGYKIGDIRGGISVGIPVKEYSKVIINSKKSLFFVHFFIFILGSAFFWLLYQSRSRQEDIIKESHKKLENEIHERKLLENMLKDSEERFRSLSNASFEGIVISEQGKILEVNKAMCKMFGYDTFDFYKMDVTNLVEEKYIEDVKRKMQSGYEFPYESTCQKKNGVLFPVEVHGRMFFYNNRHVRVAAIRDISDRKRAEKERIKYFLRLAAVFNSMDALVYVSDLETSDVLFVNKYGKDLFGEFIGKKCWEVFQECQSEQCHFCRNHKLLDNDGKPVEANVWEMQNTRNKRWYHMRDKAIEWVDGRLVKIQIATDITDIKINEKEKENLIAKLEKAIEEIRTLRGILPICSYCKKIRNDDGYYEQIESYIHKHSGVDFTQYNLPFMSGKIFPQKRLN